jgi:hypothetical protein
MKLKYFGKLPLELYQANDLKDIIDYLASIKFGQKWVVKSAPSELKKTNILGQLRSRGPLTKTSQSFRFDDEVLKELYNFLLDHYNSGLSSYLRVDSDFYNDTFGMNDEDKKKIALKYFNNFYKLIFPKDPSDFVYDSERQVIPASKFESLRRKRERLIRSLENDQKLIFSYLAGDIDFYNRTLFENNLIIKEIFVFENNLKIVKKLNRKFKFEEDTIFIPKSKAKLIYEKYQDEFHSFKQVEFMENQISTGDKVNRALITSLFDFFSNNLKIKTPSGKLFGEITNDYFSLNFSEIKLNGVEGDKHLKRIEKIKKEWENFTN